MSKEPTVLGYANTPTNTVDESDCGSAGTTDHKGGAPTRCFVEHTCEEISKISCKYAGPRIVDATTGLKIRCCFFAPLPMMEELVQLEEVFYDDSLQ
ncbi:hypothetical protein Plhal304r1_c026g0086731 [Plasmopara halstedii]